MIDLLIAPLLLLEIVLLIGVPITTIVFAILIYRDTRQVKKIAVRLLQKLNEKDVTKDTKLEPDIVEKQEAAN